MKHGEEFERLLIDYSDGALDAASAGPVEGHLAECSRCRERVECYQLSLDQIVNGLGEPPDVGDVTLVGIERRVVVRRRRRRTAFSIAAAGAMAVCALAIAFGIQVLGHLDPVPPEIVSAQRATASSFDAEIAALRERIAQLEEDIAVFKILLTTEAVPPPSFRDGSAELSRTVARDVRASILVESQREEVAAICLAAGLNLEERHGNVTEALQRYRYAAEYFPETSAAKEATERIARLTTPST